MKYLDEPRLTWVNSVLDSYQIGDRVVNGRIESFSIKKAGDDKKLAKTLEKQYQNEVSTSPIPALMATSPLGSLADASTRKLMINLISTMNATFPDYDFSNVGLTHFHKEANIRVVQSSINSQLAEMVEQVQSSSTTVLFLEKLWASLNDVITPEECDIYSYVPDMDDSDPFCDGTLWSFNFFFHNKNMKKMLYFTCMARSMQDESMDLEDDGLDDDRNMDTDDGEDATEVFDGVDWEDGA